MNEIDKKLLEAHGNGLCSCGVPKAQASGELSVCSYPHGRLPVTPIDGTSFYSWESPQ